MPLNQNLVLLCVRHQGRAGERAHFRREALDDEWCWEDSGYPIQDWLIIPYDQATVQQDCNATERLFNVHRCTLHVFASPQNMPLDTSKVASNHSKNCASLTINSIAMVQDWIRVCMIVHMFAFNDEQDLDLSKDAFYRDGIAFERELSETYGRPWE
ncbi:hypothetical protein BT69DRAFT_1298606 [Atractiella rhizophila]|nr:hypothetical protein BT69DRAFT_1298606 [Atractiella rhizophila]